MSAASGGNSEPKQGQQSQSARGFCPRSTMRVPQPDIIEHFGNADAVPQPPERCLSRQAGIVRCCLNKMGTAPGEEPGAVPFYWVYLQGESEEITKPRPAQTVSDARGGVLWQYRIILSAAAAGAVLKPQGGNCAVLPYITGLAAAPRTGQITCTGQPAWSGGCNELQQLPGSSRTGP